jgi:hypothetical protein
MKALLFPECYTHPLLITPRNRRTFTAQEVADYLGGMPTFARADMALKRRLELCGARIYYVVSRAIPDRSRGMNENFWAAARIGHYGNVLVIEDSFIEK